MIELITSAWFLAGLFFVVAFAYSSVGLGGGSSYTALMAILGFNALTIPMLSLVFNLFVTSASSFNFIRQRHGRIGLILPFLLSSVPMSYLGGALQLPKEVFYWILLASLLFVATRIYFWDSFALRLDLTRGQKLLIALLSGALLGLLAGIVGIGGGIYLVPLIIVLGLGNEKEAAACGAVFVWLNSLSALISRLQYNPVDLAEHLSLIVSVFIGGVMGSFMGSVHFSPRLMQQVLGVIVVVAVALLSVKVLSLGWPGT